MDAKLQTATLEVVCPHCHTADRVAAGALSRARCSRCGAALFDGRPVAVDAESFARHVDRSELPVVVDFWAPWCAPCRMMAPVFEAVARELEPGFRFLKVNTDEAGELAARYRVVGIPTFAIFKRGVETARTAGAMTPAAFSAWVRSHA